MEKGINQEARNPGKINPILVSAPGFLVSRFLLSTIN